MSKKLGGEKKVTEAQFRKGAEKIRQDAKKVVDSAPEATVTSEPVNETPVAPAKENKVMRLDFNLSKGARKDPRYVIFNFADERPGSVQFLRSAFPGTGEEGIPQTISMEGEFAEKHVRVAETPEQRKARLAAMPKLTPEQKLAKAEEKVARLRAKLAAAAAAPTNEPVPA